MDPQQPQPGQAPGGKKIFIGIGIAAAVLAILGIVIVARQTRIPSPGTTNTHRITTPTLQPTIPQTMDDRMKVLEDTAAGVDQVLTEPTPQEVAK